MYYCLIWNSSNLEGQVPVFISARNRVAQLCPQALRLTTYAKVSQSQSHVTTDGQSVSQSVSQYVLVSSPLWDLRPDINSVWNLLSCLCGAPSLTRGRVCLLSVTVSSICPLTSFSCIFCILYVMHVLCIYNIYKVCQPRLRTADHAPLIVAYATTAVEILERSYALPPTSLNLLYFNMSKSKSHYDLRSVSISRFSSSLWDLLPDIAFCPKVDVWRLLSCFCVAASLTRSRVFLLLVSACSNLSERTLNIYTSLVSHSLAMYEYMKYIQRLF
jgi:hypothetical protein